MYYIWECILHVLDSAVGVKTVPLRSTGELPTNKDTWVGGIAIFVIMAIVIAVGLLVRHLTGRNQIKKRKRNDENWHLK